jgi:hypothetical protein
VGVSEWSNEQPLRGCGLVPAQVQILSPTLRIFSLFPFFLFRKIFISLYLLKEGGKMLQNILGILAFLMAVLVIYDVWAVNKKDTQAMKLVWTILAVFFSIITGIVYYFVRKR